MNQYIVPYFIAINAPSISTCWYNKCVFIDTQKHFGLIKLFLLVTSPWEKTWVSGSLLPRLDNLEDRKILWSIFKMCVYVWMCVLCVCALCYLCAVCVFCVSCCMCVCVVCFFCVLYANVYCVCFVHALSVCACAVCVVCCMCVPMPLLLEDKRQIHEVILFPSLLVSNVSHRLSGWLGKCLCQMSNLANFVFLNRV